MAEENKKTATLLKTISLAWELGYLIALPLVILAFLGRLLDKKMSSSPVFLLIGIFLAIIISGVLVFRKARGILKEAEK
jgi:F0F1-type ATP synthase assembly protein I